jgi:hypothetical protein
MAAATTREELINHELDKKPLMVTVTAPATLPAGYTFEAFLNDDPNRPFICEVVRIKQSDCGLPPRTLELSKRCH